LFSAAVRRPGEQLPGVGDRLALEVVAEAEVAQHLEERVVARGVADVLQVVVLAAGAHAALRRGGAGVGRLSLPRNTSLNCTMPLLVNSSGSLARKLARMSFDFMLPAF
jgi:hypothetical protein